MRPIGPARSKHSGAKARESVPFGAGAVHRRQLALPSDRTASRRLKCEHRDSKRRCATGRSWHRTNAFPLLPATLSSARMTPSADYLSQCRGLIETVERQQPAIHQAAEWFAATILAGRMVHLFGSGHSRILVEETWPRYGS